MILQAQFIPTDDPRWTAMLAGTRHDFYHRPEYVEFAARHSDGQGQAFFAQFGDAALLVPLVIRPLPNKLGAPPSWRDAASPYGYASPLLIAHPHDEAAPVLWQSFVTACQEASIISVFLRTHPLLPLPDGSGEIGALVCEGETVVIDLTETTDEMWHQTRKNHRISIHKLQKNGFHAVIDNWTELEHFILLYWETMRRVGAKDEYLFSRDYFHELKTLSQGHMHLCSVLNSADETVAAGLFFCCQGIVQYHLSGTAAEYAKYSPTKLMLDAMRHWAKNQGYVFLHLGGGIGCHIDTLFEFKSGFSNHRAKFHTLRLVCDPERYIGLATKVEAENKATDISQGYFPVYRQPCRIGEVL